MPTKKTTKKTTKKKASSRPTAKKKTAGKKSAAKKTTTRKATTQKAPAKKKVVKKPAAKKPAAKKPAAKKKAIKKAPVKKSTAKKTVTKKTPAKKPVSKKPVSNKPAAKKPAPKKPVAKKPVSKKPVAKNAPMRRPAPAAKAPASGAKPPAGKPGETKTGPKGITVVEKRPGRSRRRSRPPKKPLISPIPSLLGPGKRAPKPMIASGPKNKLPEQFTIDESKRKKKSPFNKRELDKYRMILVEKRIQLLGDMSQFEGDALKVNKNAGARESQDAADQGSESYERSLSLNLAAADREMINKIDAAIARIDARTYGLCELTGQPISKVRLAELPWATHTIEAARNIESGSYRPS